MGRINLIYAPPDGSEILGSCSTATAVQRAWVLNEVGTATYEVPLTEPRLAEIVAYGAINWLYEDGVPPFVGYVEERRWGDFGVSVGLRSAEGLLKGQLTRQSLVLGADGKMSTGVIAYNVFLSGVLRNGASPLRTGIFDAGKARFMEYSYADVLDAFAKLSESYKAAFWVDEDLRVHFRDSRGEDKRTEIVLVHGRNLINVTVTESLADTINAAVGLGEGNDIAAKPKKAWRFTPTGQFRGEVFNLSNAADGETVAQLTEDELRQRRHPKVTIEAELIREAPEWGLFFLGDIVRVVSPVVPWQSEYDCRVIGAEVGQENKMRLVLEVLPPETNDAPSTWLLA